MICSPHVGQEVQLWYKNHEMPLHGRIGIVRISGRGKPRNHLVRVGTDDIVVPCGNMRFMPVAAGNIAL